MEYYAPRKSDFPVTQFTVIDSPFKIKRRIQSYSKAKVPLREVHSSEKMTNIHSNRQLYFLTLLSQYNQLKVFSGRKEEEIKHCSGFHSSMIDHRNRFAVKKKERRRLRRKLVHKKQLWDYDLISLYPELSMPVRRGEKNPLVIDLLRKEGISFLPKILQNALYIHLNKTRGELKELCESGLSDNYYNYENLITISKIRKGFISSRENMKILFKSTLFSNMALLDSLQYPIDKRSRKVSFYSANDLYMGEIMKRLQVRWVREYFNEVNKRRKKLQVNI